MHEMREELVAAKRAQRAQDRRKTETPPAPEILKGDRGAWKGVPRDPMRVVKQQLAMETKLIRQRAARATARERDSERKRRDTAELQLGGRSAEGVFNRVSKGDASAGGQQVEAAGHSTDGWARWEATSINNRRWATLDRWWHWQTESARPTPAHAKRFQTLIIAQDGVCGNRVEGIRCQNGGYNRQGRTRCGGCRAAKGATGCQVCGTEGDIRSHGWGSMGRWTQLCSDCITGGQALPMSALCGGCGINRAVRATVDGSGSCKDCAWSADSAMVWMARSRQLCEHGARQEGIQLSIDQLRHTVVLLARNLARRESFVGNVVRWAEIVTWLTTTPHIPVTRRGGDLRGDWEEHAPQPTLSKQATLKEVGITGGHQTVGLGGTARTDKNRARCQVLPDVRGPRPREESSGSDDETHSDTHEPRAEEEGRRKEGVREREVAPEAAEGDGPAEKEERGGGARGMTPGAAACGARGARLAGGRRLPAARDGGGKTKTKKQMDKGREGSGSASTPVALRRRRSGLVGPGGQGGGGRTWDNDGQGADRPRGKPPD